MAYNTYCSRNTECQNTLEYTEEELHPLPVLQLRQPRFQFRQMSKMQFCQKEQSPRQHLEHPLSQELHGPNIVGRHLRPPRPLSQTLDECKQDALVSHPQDETAPMKKLRKPHPVSKASEKQNVPLQQEKLDLPIAEQVRSPPEQQSSLKQPEQSHQQESSLKQQQLLLKQLKPSPIQQRLLLKRQPSSPAQQESSVEQEQSVLKQAQPSQSQSRSSLKPPTNNVELQNDNSDSGKNSSGTLKVKKKAQNNKNRRRKNVELSKLLMPKNAITVLNELLPNHLRLLKLHQIKCSDPHLPHFRAEITMDDRNYKGYGISKAAARNEVAEQVIRDFILKQMRKQFEGSTEEDQREEGEKGELPIVQFASYALYKLLAEWKGAGHMVPPL